MHLCIHGNKIPAECGSCFPKNIHDFCSQFVAEVLSKSGAVKLKKKESLYLPGQLVDEKYSGFLICVFCFDTDISVSLTS